MAKTLLKGGIIVTGDPDIGDFMSGDLLIDDERIIAVDREIKVDDAEVIDAENMIVMPGLVQAHLHTWQTGIRAFGSNWTTPQYFKKMHGSIATKYTAQDIYYGTIIGAFDQINSGTTALFEWCHNNPTPEHSDASIDALDESGIRAVFCHASAKPEQKEGEPHYSKVPMNRDEVSRLRNGRLASDDGLVTMALGILGPDFGTDAVFLEDLKLAREFGLVSSAHVWNASWRVAPEGYENAFKAGLIGPDHNVVHAVYSSEEEIKGLVDAGATFTATTACELMGSYQHAIGRLSGMGVSISLGADNQTKIACDMFGVMRHAIQSQRLFDHQANPDRPADLSPRSAREAFEWGTIEGARMMGMEDEIGSLTPGKKADIVLLDGYDLGIFPVNDPVNTIVYYADRSSVDSVMIDGVFQKRNGELVYPASTRKQKQIDMVVSLQKIIDHANYTHEMT